MTEKMFNEIFELEHSSPEGGNLGFSKTCLCTAKRFWIENIRKRIQEKIESCTLCNLKRDKTVSYSNPGIKLVAQLPMQILELNVQGPFHGKPGPKHLFGAPDSLTRFKFARAVSSQKTPVVVKFLTIVLLLRESGFLLVRRRYKIGVRNNQLLFLALIVLLMQLR